MKPFQGHTSPASGSRRAVFPWLLTAFWTVAVFSAALVGRSGIVGLPPIYDELYHLLAAMSWQDDGTFDILDGEYTRGALFTRLVAFSYDLFGERSTTAARFLPSVIPGALMVAILALWARIVAGWVAAFVVAFFLLLWPNGIEVSQYVRFYSIQGLLFVCGALAVYAAVTGNGSVTRRVLLVILAALCLVAALKLQLMTIVGAAALGLWVAIVYGPGLLRRHVWLRWVVAISLAAILVLLFSGILNETLQFLWTTYRWEPWPAQRDTTFYHRDFRDNYPTFWPLYPVAALISLRARFVPAAFCVVLFTTTFFVQSFGGLKNIRYLYPTMPFFFVTWGIAIAYLAPGAARLLRDSAREGLAPVVPARVLSVAVAAVLGLSTLFVIGANVGFERSLNLITGRQSEFLLGKRRWEWPGVREATQPWLERGSVVITTEELLTVQWLGDYDVSFNKPRFSEMESVVGPGILPFTSDFRTGRPIASEVEDFRPIVTCLETGLVLSNSGWVNGSHARAFETMAEEAGAKVTILVSGGFSMLAWQYPPGATPAQCALPEGVVIGAADRLLASISQPRQLQ